MIFNIFGGLAIFIFGMKMMSDGLHVVAGEKMRSVLRLFSANRVVAILSGTAVTAVIQSSSASTVMVIGFVNAGLLNLVQAIGIIFGANIGTTVTAQLVAFDISWIIMPSIVLGLLLGFIPNARWTGWGTVVIGFGFLFLGMRFMSDELKVLSNHPGFMSAFQMFRCAPVDGVIPPLALFGAIGVGLLATLIIQSSSACTGIIIALGAGGIIDLYTAVALVLGANVGTTVTAQLAAIPANRVAKQAALAHTLFNTIGVLVAVGTFWFTWNGVPIFFQLIDWLSSDGALPRKIANAHTVFNICTTLLLTPFIPLLATVCRKIIPEREAKTKYQRLEPHLLDTPSIALAQTSSALRKMLKKAWNMVDCALKYRDRDNEANQKMKKILDEMESRIDERQQDITDYLAKLMLHPLSQDEAKQIPLLLHCTNDAERIGDHTAIIMDIMGKLRLQKSKLSCEAEKEFSNLHALLSKQSDCALALLEKRTPELISSTGQMKQKIVSSVDASENAHFVRISAGTCRPDTGILYLQLLEEIRKISRHLANITDRAENICAPIPKARENL